MIARWFKRQPTGADQIRDFIERLSQSNPEDLGLAIAVVEHTANTWFIHGDFYRPKETIDARPMLIETGLSEAQRLQQANLAVMAVGWIVWVHTFRATKDVELQALARSMWALLIRGAPYAMAQQWTLEPVLGFELRLEDPSRVPVGFG